MADREALGRLAVLVMVFVVFYDTFFALFRLSAETIYGFYNATIGTIDNLIVLAGGGEPVYPTTENLLEQMLSWEVFVFTNAMALAIIIFIDVVKRAMS